MLRCALLAALLAGCARDAGALPAYSFAVTGAQLAR
jgi:hypothetical protein